VVNGAAVPVDAAADHEVLKEQKAGGRKWNEVQVGMENDTSN
jgi:hypothetical protein